MHRTTRRFLRLFAFIATCAAALIGSTGVAAAHTGTTDPYVGGSVFTDIGAGRTAIDVGDAWFQRTGDATGETLLGHLHVPGGIDESHLCLSATPFTERIEPGSCLNTGADADGVMDLTVPLGTTYVGGPLYIQIHVVTGGETAYGGHVDEPGGAFFGNLVIPQPSTTVEEETCVSEVAAVTSKSYTIVAPGGATTTVPDMTGQVPAGSTVTVTFTIAEGCSDVELSLVSYRATGPTFDPTTADEQVLFDSDTGFFDAGTHSLTVTVPDCYFQIDFVRGAVIAQLGPEGTDNFYSAQGRLIDADNGGTTSCTPPPDGDPEPVVCEPGMHGVDTDADGVEDTCVLDEVIEEDPLEPVVCEPGMHGVDTDADGVEDTCVLDDVVQVPGPVVTTTGGGPTGAVLGAVVDRAKLTPSPGPEVAGIQLARTGTEAQDLMLVGLGLVMAGRFLRRRATR